MTKKSVTARKLLESTSRSGPAPSAGWPDSSQQ
jgi:hypothetical protein